MKNTGKAFAVCLCLVTGALLACCADDETTMAEALCEITVNCELYYDTVEQCLKVNESFMVDVKAKGCLAEANTYDLCELEHFDGQCKDFEGPACQHYNDALIDCMDSQKE